MQELPKAVQAAEQQRQNDNLGMMDMFAEIAEVTAPPPLPHTPVWSDKERLKGEKDTLGLFLTGHPIDTYREELKRYTKGTLSAINETKYGETTLFAGLIMDVANFGNRSVISLDDGTGRIEVSCYAERFARVKDKLKLETVVIIEGTVREREGQFFASLTDVMTLTDARKRWLKKISIKIAGDDLALFNALQELLINADASTTHYLSHQMSLQNSQPRDTTQDITRDESQSINRLGVPINLCIYTDFAIANVNMPENWQINPDDSTVERLKTLVKQEHLHLHFS